MSSLLAYSDDPNSDIVRDGVVGLLIVSPNAELRSDLTSSLTSDRWFVLEAASGAEALEKMDGQVSLLLLDPGLPDLRPDDFKDLVQAQYPDLTIVPMNPHTRLPIVSAPSPDSIIFEIARRLERSAPLRLANAGSLMRSQSENSTPGSIPGFVGAAASVQRLCSMLRLVAPRDTTVLITGESGTGKDIVARALHQLSTRRVKPFVVINCAAIPEALMEAELFGYVKGAFTGALQSRIGRIHSAQGGTLFLDEIGELPLGLQSKLLRFLEQGEVQRLGCTDTLRVDVRVIAATNSNLQKLVQEGGFRADLFYRLSIFPVEVTPLRERMEDLGLLAQSFLAKFCPHQVTLSAEAVELLEQHRWPGNVRELRNVIERASIMLGNEKEIRAQHILL
jgi:transcriptional regulator with GAF, ATPase, and Fis domain/CheY-like chemotaxis protein